MTVMLLSSEPAIADANPADLQVAQLLALARAANVAFEMQNDRLVVCFSHVNWSLWPAVRSYLDEIGIETLQAYFQRTTADDRARLSAAA